MSDAEKEEELTGSTTGGTEEERTERASKMGRPDGLYQSCMKEIKDSHTIGQALRSAALAAGVMSNQDAYAELLGQFYVTTNVLETRMEAYIMKENSNSNGNGIELNNKHASIVTQVKSLGYNFREGYERDLEYLLGSKWKHICEEFTTKSGKEYIQRLSNANEIEIAAAAFILWGPLIIGGGAALKPRVKKSFGEGATNVFHDVVGNVNGVGRAGRRRNFIDVYDALLDGFDSEVEKKEIFDSIVKTAGEFMLLNNGMMLEVKKRPWWSKYALTGVVTIAAAMAMRLVPSRK